MAQITTGLPNNGHTTHFAISYDDTLAPSDGLERAVDLLAFCESDLTMMWSWFTGVNFAFAFPINVQITGRSGGAEWFGTLLVGQPIVTIKPDANPSTGLIRYLLVSEVTEMFMLSQVRNWYEYPNEGSIGESLSRFLASEFLVATGISKMIFPDFFTSNLWLNDPARDNFVDDAPDIALPGTQVGCGVCFLFYLKYQLGFSIQQIINASAPTLGGVHANLTGQSDGWIKFKSLVDLHYSRDPITLIAPRHGTFIPTYNPPLDNVFPVADLDTFIAPTSLSWVSNSGQPLAWITFNHPIPVDVEVLFASEHPDIISISSSRALRDSSSVSLEVKHQGTSFTSKVVRLFANYAGKQLFADVKVIRPEDLPVAELIIQPDMDDDPCSQHFIAGTPQKFIVKNPDVLLDQSGVTYQWTVIGASAPVTNTPVLTIPTLPPQNTSVTVKVILRNLFGIQAKGELVFSTMNLRSGLSEDIRRLNCALQNIRAINTRIPRNVPVEGKKILENNEVLTLIEHQAKQMASAANLMIASIKAIRVNLKANKI